MTAEDTAALLQTLWMPASTAPPNTDILIINDYGWSTRHAVCVGRYDDRLKCWINTYNGKPLYGATHWMPLPPDPEPQL